jgi:hypothetical protein
MNRSDEKLNQLLDRATLIPPSSNLAERIIAQAQPLSQQHSQPQLTIKTAYLKEEGFIKQILCSLIFPKPAYALACSMLVGVLLGWQNPEANTNTIQLMTADEELSSLFLAEVNFDE